MVLHDERCYIGLQMRVSSVRATDFFSFDELALAVGPRLTVLLGPNGAGKTNVIRAIQLARQAVQFAASQTQAGAGNLAVYVAARRDGAPSDSRTEVTVGIELDAERERQLAVQFVRAAIVSGLARDAKGSPVTPVVLQWVHQQVDEDALAPLFAGELAVKVPREGGDSWEASYRFTAGQATYEIDLTGGLGGIRLEGDDRQNGFQYDTMSSRLGLRADSVDQAQPFDLARVLPEFGHMTALSVEPITAQPVLDALRQFYVALGVDTRGGPSRLYGLASILDPLIRQGIAILSEARLPPRTAYGASEVPTDDDRSWLPLRLYQLKNGGANQRERFDAVRVTYQQLTGGPAFDLTAKQLPQAGESSAESGLQINLILPGRTRDIPIEFGGTGAWEALALSELLAGRENCVLILDEPAVNLHPVAQRRLLSRLLQGGAQQSVLVTHSPYLVPAGDRAQLAQIVRIDRSSGVSHVHRLEDGGDEGRSTWVKELAGSADARSLLFATGVILLEGDTELGALAVWFDRCPTARRLGSPEQLNVSLQCVGGDRNFRTYFEICRRFGVPWGAVCDGAALDLSRGKGGNILWQLQMAGAADQGLASSLEDAPKERSSFAEIRDQAGRWGVFTLATGANKDDESFESYLERVAPEAIADARRAEQASKPRQGRHVAERLDCPPEVDELYGQLLSHLGLQ